MIRNIAIVIITTVLLASCSQHECAPFDYKATGIDTLDYQGYRLFSDGSDTIMVEYRSFNTYYMKESTGGFAAKGECKNGFGVNVGCDELQSSFDINFLRTDDGYEFRITSSNADTLHSVKFSHKGQINTEMLHEYDMPPKELLMQNVYIKEGIFTSFTTSDGVMYKLASPLGKSPSGY